MSMLPNVSINGRSRLAPVIKVAKMLKRHLPNVLSYVTHRITNAVSEGLNSKIQTIKKMAYGFRNLEHGGIIASRAVNARRIAVLSATRWTARRRGARP